MASGDSGVSRSVANQLVRPDPLSCIPCNQRCQPFSSEPARSASARPGRDKKFACVSRSVANQLVRHNGVPFIIVQFRCQPFSSEPARSADESPLRRIIRSSVSRSVANQLVRQGGPELVRGFAGVSAVQ